MHGFEPQNMFTMMNNMMKDPEIQKFAKNFEEQMKNSMKDFEKSKNNETPNTTENSCPSPSSSPKTTENSCSSPKTKLLRLPNVFNSNVQCKNKQPKIRTKLCFNSIAEIRSRTGSIEHE